MAVAVVTVLSLEIIVPPRFEIDGKDEARAPPSVGMRRASCFRPPIEQTIQLDVPINHTILKPGTDRLSIGLTSFVDVRACPSK